MGFERQNFEVDAAASLLGWWHDAGVDVAIGEAPHDWLGVARVVAAPAVSSPPQTLAALVDDLMTGDIPDAGPPRRRLPPSGDPISDLMILVDFPDAADIASGTLLSNPIFDKMLDALGRNRSSTYIAALCPGRPLTGRLSDESTEALALFAQQHIAHVAPKQLWLIGGAASRAILGFGDAEAKGKLHSVNLAGTIMDTIATAHPRMFEGSKSRKAAAWTEMQRLMTRETGEE